MKKILSAVSIFAFIIASAYPFRTSCNEVVQIDPSGTEGLSVAQVSQALKLINLAVCGTVPSSLAVYTH